MAINRYVTGGPKAAVGTTGQGVSEREDLANFISMITRDETPFTSSIGKTKSTSILHEWQTDELAAPVENAVPEGSQYGTADLPDQTAQDRTRLGNYNQIFSKTLEVSGTKRAVDQAGVADEYAYQLKKRGTELRRDVEFAVIHNWQASTGTGTRKMGTIQAFIDSENVYDAQAASFNPAWAKKGVDGTYNTGGVTNTDLTTIALSDIDEVMQRIYEEGGKAGKIMVSPKNRREISSQAQAAGNVRRNIDERGSLRQSVDVYMSDFGDVMVVPNYIMGLSNNPDIAGLTQAADFMAIVYDPMWFNIATLRPLQELDIAQVGDYTRGQMVEEMTLEVRNPKGWGLITNIGA